MKNYWVALFSFMYVMLATTTLVGLIMMSKYPNMILAGVIVLAGAISATRTLIGEDIRK